MHALGDACTLSQLRLPVCRQVPAMALHVRIQLRRDAKIPSIDPTKLKHHAGNERGTHGRRKASVNLAPFQIQQAGLWTNSQGEPIKLQLLSFPYRPLS